MLRSWRGALLSAWIGIAAGGAAAAAETTIIHRVTVDVTAGTLIVDGAGLLPRRTDDLRVWLGSARLGVLSVADPQLVAQLPAGTPSGTHRLTVVTGSGSRQSAWIDVTFGATGPQGPAGPEGPQGPAGATGPAGPAGPAGADGTDGADGTAGPQGPQGEPGLRWRGAWDAMESYAARDAVSHEGSSWVALRDSQSSIPVVGPDWDVLAQRGETGATGATGLTGDAGPQGAPGPQGIPGPAGPQGPQGPQGPSGIAFVRTIVVSPSPTGALASGSALLAALAGITDASATKPYLLKLEPGLYDLGSGVLAMKPYVDVEGSGEGVTIVTSNNASLLKATVAGANESELRLLTVRNTGSFFSVAVLNESGASRLAHVTARASSSLPGSYALLNRGASADVRSSTLEGGIAVRNEGDPRVVTIEHSSVRGRSASVSNGAAYDVRIGASQLVGPVQNPGAGLFRCAGVYDSAFQSLGPACTGVASCVDDDRDGFYAPAGACTVGPFDCNDSNAAIRPLAAELCDSQDNDCDGVIDEGCAGAAALVLTPASRDFGSIGLGQFSSFTFTVSNVSGGASGIPAVQIVGDLELTFTHTCTAALAGGATCQVVVRFSPSSLGSKTGTLHVSASPGGDTQASLMGTGICVSSGSDEPDLDFRDTNCDGIDGTVANAIFVDGVSGNDLNAGTMAAPKRTIGAGLQRAAGQVLPAVYVSKGTYLESVTLQSGISLYGGYDASNGWSRSLSHLTRISSPSAVGVDGANLGGAVEIQLFHINSTTAVGVTPNGDGRSAYGVRIRSSSGPVRLVRCTIAAGAGAPAAPEEAAGAAGTPGGPGGSAAGVSRGAPGMSACGAAGGRGGAGVSGVALGEPGEPGAGVTGAPGGQPGSAGSCSPGFSSNGGDAPQPFQPGATGGAGVPGAPGASIGTFDAAGNYVPAPGGNGAQGQPGGGGGGGGSGGGTASPTTALFCANCEELSSGAGGGGGGGGCGGGGGRGGRSAGGSFAVASLASEVVLRDTTLEAAPGDRGGRGGNGGPGGAGGPGGQGAFGESRSSCTPRFAGDGARGTSGGNGGAAGAGAGGAGGPSVCVAYMGTAPILEGTSCTVGSGGPGGLGGGGGTAGSPAPAGPNGVAAQALAF